VLCLAIRIAILAPVLATPPRETLVQLQLQPMAAPRPALRYLLLPELKEMTPGNPIEGYLQCMLDFDFTDERAELSKSALRMADRAARMDKPDWQVLIRSRIEGIGLLHSDVGKVRALANSLQGRLRVEVAQGQFDDALGTVKTLLAMARHTNEHITLISHLVAAAIAQLAIGSLEDMIGQPNCPNLYWALTNLPSPLVTAERGMEGERLLIEGVFHQFANDQTPMNGADLRKRIEHLLDGRRRGDDKEPSPQENQAWLAARIKEPAWVVGARARLVDYGIPEERLQKFPIEQIILLDEKREFEARRDECMKLLRLPTWQFEEQAAVIEPPAEKLLFGDLLPALSKVRRAQGRLEQRIALLRVIEAIRLYAANHAGQLPACLEDVSVPLPVDPFTGKPFRYSLDGAVAHLRGSPPRGQENVAVYNYHYQITIRK
jgi:hypothetical protein